MNWCVVRGVVWLIFVVVFIINFTSLCLTGTTFCPMALIAGVYLITMDGIIERSCKKKVNWFYVVIGVLFCILAMIEILFLPIFGGNKMIVLVCPYCNTEIEVEELDNIVECPNCGNTVSKENAGKIFLKR